MVCRIRIDESTNLKDKILITGFHGVGAAGYIAVRHLTTALHSKKVGYLESDMLPGFISLEDKNLPLPYEFYEYENYIIFLARSQPTREELNELIKTIVDWAIKNKFKEAILVGGLDNKFKSEDEELKSVPTKKFMSKNKWSLLDKGLFVTGPLALLLAHFEIENFPAVALLPYAERERPDPRAAAIAINAINEFYSDLEIDTQELIEDAEKIEKEISSIIQGQEKDTPDSPSRGMYV